MPKREDEYWAGMKEPKGRGLCPKCGSSNISYNKRFKSWRCNKCENSFPVPSYGPGREFGKKARWFGKTTEGEKRAEFAGAARKARAAYKRKKYSTQRFSFKVIGRALSTFFRNLKKPLILVAVLVTTVIIVTAVCLSISGGVKLTAGIILSLIGIVILVWGLNSLSKYRVSFARTFMFILISGLFIISSCAYLDIRSPADVKDGIFSAFSTEEGQFRETVDVFIERIELGITDIGSTDEESAVEEVTEEEGSTEHVYIGGGVLVGADGHYITLQNNPHAVDPSWEELKEFLLEDNTDRRTYDFNTFVCADFAEMLHNNAEAAGIRAAFVCVQLGPCAFFSTSGGHALNAFETTDRGLVYIDCTGCAEGINADKIVEVKIEEDYIPRSIFPQLGWSDIWGNMGEVEEIEVIQW